MLRRVVLYGGLLLVCLLIGHLALNATGTGKVVLEKATKADASKIETVKLSEKDAAGVRSGMAPEQRKELENAAFAAGINAGRIAELSDMELQDLVRKLPSAQKSLTAPDQKVRSVTNPIETRDAKELQENQAIKARLEAERRATQGSRVHSSATTSLTPPQAAGSPEPRAHSAGSGSTAAENRALKAGIEAKEAAAKAAEVAVPELTPEPAQEPVHESAPAEIQSAVVEPQVDTESLEIRAIQQRMDRGERVSATDKDRFYRYIADNPGAMPHSGGGSLDNVGGPDGVGYYYVDNVTPDTATYSWIELRGDAGATWINDISNHDDGWSATRYPIGFPFLFYGAVQDSFRVAVNGFVQFTTATGSLSNATLPSTNIAGPAICAYWDDQHLDRVITGGVNVVGYKNFGTYTVIEYDSTGIYSTSCTAPNNRLKYEVILFNDGKIKIQYDIIDVCNAADSSMTVGIQSNGAAGSAALQYCYGSGTTLTGPLPASGRAIWFYPTVYRTHDYALGGIITPTSAAYGPSVPVTVTGRFYNVGTTTESADVKYIFNGGPTVTETTASLAQWGTEIHTFATGITTPAANGAYTLTMWNDLTGDEARANDTARVTVNVFAGGSCNSAIEITTAGPDSATYNNYGAGDNNPGISCTTYNYNDMVFKKDVLAGHTVTFWVSSLSWTYKYMNGSLRWSGNCPGDSLVKCVYNQSAAGPTGYNQKFVWTNTTGATKTVYFTIGSYTSGSSYAGNFKLAWKDTDYTDDFALTAITSPLTSAYLPSQVVTVTGTAINLGQTTQSAPIKYSFNGGAAVVEATASLVRFATESHSFATQITLPGTNGTYPLSVWTDLGADQDRTNDTTKLTVTVFGGASCATAMVLPAAAYDSATYNNCGAGDLSPGVPCYSYSFNDMVFQKDVAPGETATFWVSSFAWTYKYLDIAARWGGTCPGTNTIDCFTASSTPNLNKRLTWTNSTGATQTVYVTVGNYSSSSSSYCGNFKLAWQVQTCAAVDPPYTQGFETVPYVPVLPSCMTQENGNGTAPVWESYATTPRTGTKDGTISSVAAGNDDWLFTPGINMEEGREYFVSYWRRVNSASYPDSMEVKAGIAPTAAAMTITVAAMDSCKSTAYVQKVGGFTAPSSAPYYVGWHNVSKTSSARTMIDDINIAASDVCSTGVLTVNSAVGQDSVTLAAALGAGWYGGMPRYQWYTGVGCVNGNQIPGATTSSYKTYASGTFSCRVYVLDSLVCVACDSAIATVINCSAPLVPPLYENFDLVTAPALPICWSQQNVNADAQYWQTSTTYTPRSLPNQGYIRYSAAGVVNDDWLFSRPVALTGGVPYLLSYYYKMAWSSVSYLERMEVLIGTGPNPASMTTTIHAAWDFDNIEYLQDAISFTPDATNTYWIGWHCISGDDEAGIGIDDIALAADTACVPPTSVTVNDAAGIDSVLLTANYAGGFGAPAYQWYTGNGIAPANEIVGATSSTLWVFTSGWYTCKVWLGGDPLGCMLWDSAYADVVDCNVPGTWPWAQHFDDATPAVCWTQQDVNADGTAWTISTSYPRSVPNSAYISYDWENASNDWLYSRAFSATAGDSLVVEYWYRMAWSSQSYTERMEVYAGTANDAASMTIQIDPSFTFDNIVYAMHAGLLIIPTTGTYYIGWHSISDANQGGIAVDDINVYRYGQCTAPTTVDVPAVTAEASVTLTCTVTGGSGGPVSYQWYTGLGCVAGNNIVGATTNQYTTTTSGVFSCKAWLVDSVTCAGCDSALATVLPDHCLPGTYPPVFENFDAVSTPSLPDCWRAVDVNADGIFWHTSTSYPLSLPNSVSTVQSPSSDWIFTKPIRLYADTLYMFTFAYRAESASYPQSAMAGVGTAPTDAAMTDTLVQPFTFTNTTYTVAGDTFRPTVGGTYYFGVKNITSVASVWWTYMDDFLVIRPGVDCSPPTSVTVNTVIAPDTVTLTCTASGGYGSALQYQWYTGGTCATGFEIVGATSPTYSTTVSGDYSCKAYYCNNSTLYGACGAGTATVIPCVSSPYNAWPTPFAESFESVSTPALPDCWRYLDVNADARYWSTTTSYPHTGLRSVYLLYSYTSAEDDWLVTKALSLTAGDTMNVDYWYRCYSYSTTYTENLAVFAGTSPSAAGMTITVDPFFTFSNVSAYVNRIPYFIVPTTGIYYIGFHCASAVNQGGVVLDDIMVYKKGYCIAPTVDVPAVAYPATVTLTATASGGLGSAMQYQWYTGATCAAGSEIIGATTAQYTTTVSGVYSCKAYRDTCAACDSAYADVMVPQPGELCSNAITLTPPIVGTPTVVSGTTVGFYAHVPSTCDANVSNGPDLYYTMTLTGLPLHGCRKIAMALSGGDTYLAVYQGVANCASGPAYLCNDDDAEFTALPGWDVPAQHPTGTGSYVAADLEPGTYLIRVAYTAALSGAYTLTVYDNGPCYDPCDPATGLTVYLNPTNPSQVWWHFTAPSQGTYKIYTTTVKNNDGNPDNGADPQWSLDTTLEVLAAGVVECVDLDGLAAGGYENYSVVHDCPIIGRCCYGDVFAPSCADNTQLQCQALSGTWNRYRNCTANPCPVVQPAPGDSCADATLLGGPLPIVATGTTVGKVNNIGNSTVWHGTQPACWRGTWYASAGAGPDVFWHWVVPATGYYKFSTCSTTPGWDNTMLIFNYTCPTMPDSSNFICGNEDAGSTLCSAYSSLAVVDSVSLTASQHILIDCDGYGSTSAGAFTLTITQD